MPSRDSSASDSSASLGGKVAVVTGASRGIGAELSVGLAAAGAAVVVNYKSDLAGAEEVAKTIRGSGGNAVAVQGDVGDEADVRRIIESALDQFGQLDVVVNNAGRTRFGPAAAVTPDDWEDIVNTNLRGTYLMSVRAAEQMAHGGSIINVSSCAAKLMIEYHSIYTMSKTGIEGLSKQLAIEYAAKGIRVNVISPGSTLNERNLEYDENYAESWARVTPMGRVGMPEDLVGPVLFFASSQSEFVTGQTINVDGGWTLRGWSPSMRDYDLERDRVDA